MIKVYFVKLRFVKLCFDKIKLKPDNLVAANYKLAVSYEIAGNGFVGWAVPTKKVRIPYCSVAGGHSPPY